jgi:hypothetical protein
MRGCANKINTVWVIISAGRYVCNSCVFKARMPTWTALSVLTAATDGPTARSAQTVACRMLLMKTLACGQHKQQSGISAHAAI